MKTILLPLEDGDGLQSMLETAWSRRQAGR
jgi:hypothetical protein